jgi:hypothetical protein
MMTQLGNRIVEGGPVFMITLIVIIVGITLLFVLALIGKKDVRKMSELIGHLSLFGLIWGFMGSTFGLIGAFDAIESIDKVASTMFASGLKIALLSTLGGCVTFLIGRVAMFVLAMGLKPDKESTED